MGKRSKSDEEEDYASHDSGSEQSSQPTKKSKKSKEKRPEKKSEKSKSRTKESSPPEASSKKGGVAKNIFANVEGDRYVDLGKKRRATVRSFKGSTLIDIREFYGSGDDLAPGKKGISLSVEQWEELKANANTIDDLIQKLK